MKAKLDPIQEAKQKAALEAVNHVRDGFVVGLGSGSTAAFAIEALGDLIKNEKMRLWGVPTSYQAFLLAVDCGIPITSLDEHPQIDLTIDGADQVTPELVLNQRNGRGVGERKNCGSCFKT